MNLWKRGVLQKIHNIGGPNSLYEKYCSRGYQTVDPSLPLDLKQYERATRFLLASKNNKFNATSEYKMERFSPWKDTKYKFKSFVTNQTKYLFILLFNNIVILIFVFTILIFVLGILSHHASLRMPAKNFHF